MKGRVVLLDRIARGRGAAALMVDGRLEDLAIDPEGDAPLPGAIYRAVADRPMKGQGGMFVRCPAARKGSCARPRALRPASACWCRSAARPSLARRCP
jgi:hypothetical protein